jgi:hypothetical protein
MRDLSIRKIPGIGRVNERLLDAIGIKVINFPVLQIFANSSQVKKIRHAATSSLIDLLFHLWISNSGLGSSFGPILA